MPIPKTPSHACRSRREEAEAQIEARRVKVESQLEALESDLTKISDQLDEVEADLKALTEAETATMSGEHRMHSAWLTKSIA
jgi:prefoldin subunit 5